MLALVTVTPPVLLQDGALWLRSTEYGDDKDRVMRKSDGTFTYFVPRCGLPHQQI